MWFFHLPLYAVLILTASSQLLNLFLGDKCDGNWLCMTVDKCSLLGPLSVSRPKICSFYNFSVPLVCCPPESTNVAPNTSAKKKTDEMCDQYEKDICAAEAKEVGMFVVGGSKAKPKTYRHMAHIGYGNDLENADWACGGSIISVNFVLTAAHCIRTSSLLARWVRVGDLDTSTHTDDAKPEVIEVSQRISHPGYKPPALYNDIALLKLVKPITFNKWTAPICLHSQPVKKRKATVTGWGRVDIVGDTSSHLLAADVSLIKTSDCRKLLPSSVRIPNGIDRNTMICAGEAEGGKDACSGDSGGPLIINVTDSCLKRQIGIVSFGQLCGAPNKPGVYTRILNFIPWIEAIVWS